MRHPVSITDRTRDFRGHRLRAKSINGWLRPDTLLALVGIRHGEQSARCAA